MRVDFRTLTCPLALAAALCGPTARGALPGTATPSDATAPATVSVAWQHQHVKMSYFGFNVLYSCDGLEGQVRRILLYLGARSDLKVSALGCPFAETAPGRHASIDAQFDIPVPAADTGTSMQAHWVDVTLAPQKPGFMGPGDCELVEALKDLLTKDLHLRRVEYRTSCVPGSLSPDGFAVTGQALKILEPQAAQAGR